MYCYGGCEQFSIVNKMNNVALLDDGCYQLFIGNIYGFPNTYSVSVQAFDRKNYCQKWMISFGDIECTQIAK